MRYLVTAALAACLALATSGCSEVAAKTSPPAPKAAAPSSLQSFDAAISPISVKLDALQATANATQTNTEATNATLDKLTSQASDIGATATNIDDNVSTALDKLDELLRRDSIAPKAEPTPAPTPAPIDAPPADKADQRTATLYLFTGPGCPPCITEKGRVPDLVSRGEVVRIVAWEDEPALFAEYGVESVPTWIRFEDGKELNRVPKRGMKTYLNVDRDALLYPKKKVAMSGETPALKPGFETLVDDPSFCFECNRHLWVNPNQEWDGEHVKFSLSEIHDTRNFVGDPNPAPGAMTPSQYFAALPSQNIRVQQPARGPYVPLQQSRLTVYQWFRPAPVKVNRRVARR